jgi:hypothetical protein
VSNGKTAAEQIQEVFERWPLYRKLTFIGGASFELPEQIRLFCSKCGGERNWKQYFPFTQPTTRTVSAAPPPPMPVGRGSSSSVAAPVTKDFAGFGQKAYICKDCNAQIVTYFFYRHWKQGADSTLIKVGQFPAQEQNPPNEVARAMSDDEAKLYRRALTCRNFSYGIGALAYLRRLVEDKMNDLLDLIEEAARQTEDIPEELQKIAEVKKSYRFDDKISYAAAVLPKHLKREGVNPIDSLHDLASEGLHHKSEDECIQIFDKCTAAFEYVFRQLRVELDDAKDYLSAIRNLRQV